MRTEVFELVISSMLTVGLPAFISIRPDSVSWYFLQRFYKFWHRSWSNIACLYKSSYATFNSSQNYLYWLIYSDISSSFSRFLFLASSRLIFMFEIWASKFYFRSCSSFTCSDNSLIFADDASYIVMWFIFNLSSIILS